MKNKKRFQINEKKREAFQVLNKPKTFDLDNKLDKKTDRLNRKRVGAWVKGMIETVHIIYAILYDDKKKRSLIN